MASFTAKATSSTEGQATLSGLSTVSYARTVYINVGGSQQKTFNIAANETPGTYTAYFSGLDPSTTYTANCAVYKDSPWTKLYSNTATFTTKAPPFYCPTVSSITVWDVTHNGKMGNSSGVSFDITFNMVNNNSYNVAMDYSVVVTIGANSKTYTGSQTAYSSNNGGVRINVTNFYVSDSSSGGTITVDVTISPQSYSGSDSDSKSVYKSWTIPKNSVFTVASSDVTVTLNSYTRSTGYGSITLTVKVYNPNNRTVYGTLKIRSKASNTYQQLNNGDATAWSAYEKKPLTQTYTNYYLGKGSTCDVVVEIDGRTYIEIGASSGTTEWYGGDATRTVTLGGLNDFYWKSNQASLQAGESISTYITAAKWGVLQRIVNEKRLYKGKTEYSFTTVSAGDRITATLYNQIANAINGMSSGAVPTVSSGDAITAARMNKLQTAINGIT